jgi:hypothetical protein
VKRWLVKITDLNQMGEDPSEGADVASVRQNTGASMSLGWLKFGVISSGPPNSPINIALSSSIAMLPAAGMGVLIKFLDAPSWVSIPLAVGVWLAGSTGIVLAWRRNRTRHTR